MHNNVSRTKSLSVKCIARNGIGLLEEENEKQYPLFSAGAKNIWHSVCVCVFFKSYGKCLQTQICGVRDEQKKVSINSHFHREQLNGERHSSTVIHILHGKHEMAKRCASNFHSFAQKHAHTHTNLTATEKAHHSHYFRTYFLWNVVCVSLCLLCCFLTLLDSSAACFVFTFILLPIQNTDTCLQDVLFGCCTALTTICQGY